MSSVAIGSIASAAIGGAASFAGASAQAGAAKDAAQLQAQEAANALAFQKQQYQTEQTNLAPYIKAGQGAIGTLSDLVGQEAEGKGPLAPWTGTFQAPTLNDTTDPGYQARLNLGETALQNSAAASGGALAGGTLKAVNSYAQDYASNEYSNVFNRAIQQYQQAYNVFQNNQQNLFNRTAGVAQGGQQAVATAGQLGQQAANTTANIDLTTGAQQGQDIQNAGAATASGYVGASNALSGGISNLGGLSILQALLQGQQSSTITSGGSIA
jgi:hypothetical protein